MRNEVATHTTGVLDPKAVVLLVLGVLLATTTALAQIAEPIEFSIDTPFIVENTTLPAGTYVIEPTNDPSLLEIRSADGDPTVLFDAVNLVTTTPFEDTEIVFNKYGDVMVLKSVKPEGELAGVTTITSHAERRQALTSGAPSEVSRPGN